MSTLKVDTIQHSGGTTGLTIDSTGRILQPAKPAFRARIAGSTGGHGDNGTLVFETEDFDIGGNYNASTGIFTAPIDGVYHFMFRAITAANTSGNANDDTDGPSGDFQKNGSIIEGTRFYHYIQGITYFHATLIGNTLQQLSANDEIKVVIGSQYVYSDASVQWDPVFEGFLVS
jgi:hypothetical protein